MKDFIKILYLYIRPYKIQVIFNIFFNIIGSIFSLFSLAMIIPFLGILFNPDQIVNVKPEFEYSPDYVLDSFYYFVSQIIIDGGKERALLIVTLFVLLMIFLKNIFVYFANFFMATIRNGVVKDMRNKIFGKILNLHIGYFSEEKKGDIISKMTTDVQEFEWSAMSSMDMLFRDPVLILVYFSSLVFISPQITLLVIVMLPVSGIIIGQVGKSLRRKSTEVRRRMGLLLSIMEETIGGLRIIKAFIAEKKINKKFTTENNDYTKVIISVARRDYLASPLSEFLGVLTLMIVMYYGSTIVLSAESAIAPEIFIGYITIFSQVINPAKALTTAYYKIQKGLAANDRISEVLNTDIAIKNKKNAIKVDKFKSEIEFKNVSFRYSEIDVLKNINIKLEKGKSIALVGQSGSGKSTLVDLLPRFYDIVEGVIEIDGKSIKDIQILSLRSLMGNVNQESILFNDTIFNNISFGVDNTTENDVIKAAKVANAHDFIMETEKGYETNIGDRGNKLSGGQRQRLSIARAVLKNPPILILDEATSALDTESERLVQDALTKLMKNRTSIVIAHRLSTIKNVDEICVLHEGEIVERGNHEELLKLNGYFKKLYDLQVF